MPASLLTDRFQGWIVAALMVIATVAFATNITILPDFDTPKDSWVNPDFETPNGLIPPSSEAWQSLYTLPAAVLAANIFHQVGFVWCTMMYLMIRSSNQLSFFHRVTGSAYTRLNLTVISTSQPSLHPSSPSP